MKTIILFILINISVYAEVQRNHEELEKITRASLMVVKKKLVIFKLNNGKFPLKLKELNVKTKDAWGREYFYKINTKNFYGYDLFSLGKDGVKSKDDVHINKQ